MSFLFRFIVLGILALIPSAHAAVSLNVSPANITNDFVGKVTLTIMGLSAGQTVRVERFNDVNGNGVVDAATDGLFRSFTVTDGQLPVIGGVRNLNVPGDDDGVVNGQIRVDLDSPGIDNVFGTASGSFIYRVSNPTNGLTPVTQAFTVAQKAYSQGIRGRVTAASGSSPLAGAFVILLDANGQAIGGTYADTTGNFALNTLPGNYLVLPFYPGYIADATFASATVVTNQFTTNNQALVTGAFTISGRITDATSGAGIAGVSMLGQSTNKLFSFSTPTDTNGNYSFAVSASQWKLNPPGSGMAQLGYLRPDKLTINITTVSPTNVNFASAKATALIYGTVKDNLNNPLNGLDTRADDQSNNLYESEGRSLPPNANYTLGVLPGTWYASLQSDTIPAGYTPGPGTNVTLSAGQAVQANFIVQLSCVHLLGKVVNTSGTPQSGLEIRINPSNGGNTVASAVTAGDGSFDLGVSGGSWSVQLNGDDAANTNLIGPNLTFTVTCGANVSNIDFVVRNVTAQITGIITNTAGIPLTDLGVYANATLNGTNYNQYVNTDGGGHFSLGVVNGTWQVGVDCNGLNTRGYRCVNNKSVTISGANAVANFVALPPDTVPPSLTSSLPANGTSGVAVNSAISFTFSEPMQTGFSITWNGNVNAGQFCCFTWSTDQRTLNCAYNTSMPAGTTIGWVLNPSSAEQNFRDQAGNALASNVSGSFTTVSASPLQVTTTSLPNSTLNTFYSQPVNATGGQQPYGWSLVPGSAPLPLGLNISGGGTISGTPTNSGTFYFFVRVTDALSATADALLSIYIPIPPLQMTTLSLTNAQQGAAYTNQLQATGGQLPYAWSVAPGSLSLPPNLNLSTGGVISGTPATNGTFFFIVRVTDGSSTIINRSLGLTIGPTINLKPTLTALNRTGNQFQLRLTGTTGQNYSIQFSTNPASPNWFPLLATNPSAASVTILDPNATNSARYYRALLGP